MKARKCDRCGKFYDIMPKNRTYDVKLAYAACSLDLCPTCCVELQEWMENLNKVISKLEEAENVQQNVQQSSGESCCEGLCETDGGAGEEGKEEVND